MLGLTLFQTKLLLKELKNADKDVYMCCLFISEEGAWIGGAANL